MARLRDAVLQDVRADEREFDLYSLDLICLRDTTDLICSHFRDAGAADFSGLHVFRNNADGIFVRNLWIHSGALEEIDLFLAIEDFEAFFDRAADVLRASI